MFMDRQELTYAKKFFIGDFKRNKMKYFYASLILLLSSLMNAIVHWITIFVEPTEYAQILNFQDFSFTILFASFVYASLVFAFLSFKINSTGIIFPQTNNSRFVKDLFISTLFLMILIITHILASLLNYGIGLSLTFLNPNTYVISPFSIKEILLSTLVILLYSVLIFSVGILLGSLLRKFKFYCLIIPAVFGLLLTTNFHGTISLITNVITFYTLESSLLIFAVKIIITAVVLTFVGYLINNKTPYENNVKYSKKLTIISAVGVLLVTFALYIPLGSLSFFFDSFGETDLPYVGNSDVIKIDVSHLEEGTTLNIVTTGISNNDNYMANEMVGDFEDTIEVSGNNLSIIYNYSSSDVDGKLDVSQYLGESLEAYLEGDTLYLNYQATPGVVLINIPSSAMLSQFNEDSSYFSSYLYLSNATVHLGFSNNT